MYIRGSELFVDFFFSFFRVRYSIFMAHTYAIIISNNTKKKDIYPNEPWIRCFYMINGSARRGILGGTVIDCHEEYTSKTCSCCGRLNHTLGASKSFTCPFCHFVVDSGIFFLKIITYFVYRLNYERVDAYHLFFSCFDFLCDLSIWFSLRLTNLIYLIYQPPSSIHFFYTFTLILSNLTLFPPFSFESDLNPHFV